MTLTRYQIRNEYGLADKELYESTDKEDAEALLEGSTMAGFVGLLRQLGDLAEFAGEVFNCLHEELMTTAARGKGLAIRLQQLETEVPSSIEIPILARTNHSTYFYDPGLEWHTNLQTQEHLISPSKLPHCIIDSYEECRGPPQLYLLDKFDVDGSGSCLKRYSDPSLLKTLTASAVLATSKLSNDDERPSKTKKKLSHMSNGERLGDSQISHSKLHQLFLMEHVEKGDKDLECHVKLKRRHLNGPPINSSSSTGYMEKFLKPYCERVHEIVDQSSSAIETEVTACNIQEDLSTPSLVKPINGDTRKEREVGSIDDDERPYMEGGPVTSLERSSSVSLCGRDPPDSTETEEKEADGDDKAGGNLRQSEICLNADVTQTEVLSQFSNVLYQSSEEEESSLLKRTQVPVNASEGGTKALQTDYLEDEHSQHVVSVETGSEMSLTGLVEDQFSSITNEESEKKLDCLLIQNHHHISTSDNSEDLSLDGDTPHDIVVPKDDETNSQEEYSMTTELSGHISSFKISSEVGTLMLDTPRDVHAGNMNPSASSWKEDALVNSDLAEISSDYVIEDVTSFVGDKDNETVSEKDLETSSDPQECLLGTQKCFSPEDYIQRDGQGQESPSETKSENPIPASAEAESLPPQDVPPSEETLICNEKHFPSSQAEKEAPNAPDQETITSLNGNNISEFVLSMDPTSQENVLAKSLHETPQEDLEITPPLPPLPPTQWWMGKLDGFAKTTETQFSPVPSLAYSGDNSFCIHRDENTHDGLVQETEEQDQSEASVTAGESQLQNEPSKATKEEQSPSEPVTWVSLVEATPEEESTEGLEALEWFSQNFKEHTNNNLAKIEEAPQLDHPLKPLGEDKNSYEQKEKVEKLPRDKEPLGIGINKIMLRKVSERNMTQLGAQVEENDSLLEIIRTKSFNLRPADASVRHNFQVAVHVTNSKVAAILEKANSLRHATAGSDDDHDSDSWSE